MRIVYNAGCTYFGKSIYFSYLKHQRVVILAIGGHEVKLYY